jgi:ubiquinone/menaquinone biosynthesis C-methylase UbiE
MGETRDQNWDSIYREYGSFALQAHEEMPHVVDVFREKGVRRVVDLGCGAGRHLVYLAQLGFEAYGLDSSREAIKMAGDSLAQQNLSASLTVDSMFEHLPYPDKFFDAVVCTKSLNHGRLESIQSAIREMERILKPGGLVFIVVWKMSDKVLLKMWHSEIIADHTYLPKTGREAGVIHFRFNKASLLQEFRKFRGIKFNIDSKMNYCLLGELKTHKPAT